MENDIDRKIDITAMHFLLVQNRHQTHGWTLIGSGANWLSILDCNLKTKMKLGFNRDFYEYHLLIFYIINSKIKIVF